MSRKQLGVCGVSSLVLAVVNCLGLPVFTVAMLYHRAKFAAIYKDMGVALPVVTRMIIGIPGALVLLATGVLVALLIAKETIPNKALALGINVVWLIITVGAATAVVYALWAPMIEMIERL